MNAKHYAMVGRWKLERSDNFEAYLKEIGINAPKRKIALMYKPSLSVEIDGDTWTTKVDSLLKSMQWTFKPGERFKAQTVDGRTFWVTVVLGEDGTVREMQENVEGNSNVLSSIVRFVDEHDKLNAICKANGVEAHRVYGRITK